MVTIGSNRIFRREPKRMIIETEVQTLPKEMNHFFLRMKNNNKEVSINTTLVSANTYVKLNSLCCW
jgi:hypothetical protein